MKYVQVFLTQSITAILLIVVFSLTAVAQQKSSYEVKQGETLYSISKKLNVTISELKQWNNLQSNEISVGQELTFYRQEVVNDSLPQSSSTPLINAQSEEDNTIYIVKSGDNLYSISREHNMTVEQLKQLNNLQSDNLSVGQQLAVKKNTSVAPSVSRFAAESTPQGLFTIYEVNGESLPDILEKFNMSESEFQLLNPGLNTSALITGREVTVLLPPSRSYANPYLQNANLEDLGEVPAITYSESDAGKSTTNGELYNPEDLTAAHSNIALGSIIFVENEANGKGIYVQVNDRVTGSGLKLSNRAYRILELQSNSQPTVKIYTDS